MNNFYNKFSAYFVGRALRRARTKAKLSQKELAERIGVSVNQLKLFEYGRDVLSCEVLIRLFLEDLRQ